MIKGILITDTEAKEIELSGELEDYYAVLNCDTIEIPTRKIGRKYFDIVCDEEGALKDNPRISAIDNLGRAMLVGNLFICKSNDEGYEVSLTKRECKYVLDRVEKLYSRLRPEAYPVLTQVGY